MRADPPLIKPAVEERLRYSCPLDTASERYPREDVTVAGVSIPRGSLPLAALSAANRDAGQFPAPGRLDLTRDPNRHLSFGLGPHFCLGAPLARMEGQVAIASPLARAGDFQLAVSTRAVRWRGGMVLRGVQALPVKITRWT